jgi:hypothetical protein
MIIRPSNEAGVQELQEFRMQSSRQRAGDVIVYCSNSGCTASVLV